MVTIYLIRHGECKGNREGLFRGRYDFPLNELGLKQAEKLQQRLAKIPFQAIYTGPLTRTRQTAEILSNSTIPVIVEEGFNNIALGEWENKPKKLIKEQYPEEWKLWTTQPEKLKLPGMEPLAEVQRRSFQALKKLLKKHEGQIFAVVSHRAVLKPLIAAILNIPEPYFWKLHMDTAAYSVVEYRESRGFTLTLLNEKDHLPDFVVEDVG